MIKNFINSSVQKWLHLGMFSLLVLLMSGLATSCKKSCPLTPKEGYEIVGNDKDCYYQELITPDSKIKDFKDLEGKLDQIEKELANGKKVPMEALKQWVVDDSGYAILDRLGAMKKKYGDLLTMDWNGYDVAPANGDMLLEYRLWKRWAGDMEKPADFMPLGSYDTNGAKATYLWNIGEDELQLFIEGGAPGGALAPGNAAFNITSHEDLWYAPTYVAENGTMAKPVRLKFNNTLLDGLDNGADMTAIHALAGVGSMGQQIKGKFEFHNANSQKKQFWANDSIATYATVLKVLNDNGLLQPAPMGGGKYAFLLYVDQNLQNINDSVPSNQYVRIKRVNSDQLTGNQLSKFAPNEVYVMHDMDPAAFETLYGNWSYVIKLDMAAKPGKPGGKQNFIKVNNPFLIRLRTASAQEKSGVTPVFWVENPILAEYKNTTPPQTNALRIVEMTYGDAADLDGTGAKIEASWFEAGGSEQMFPACYSDIQLKVQMTSDEYKSDGKVILDLNWLANQACIAAGFTSQQTGKFKLSNYKLYLTGPSLYVWENYCHGKLQELFDFYNIIADEANVGIITDLNGKKAFGVEGQINYGPKRGGKMVPQKSAAAGY